ncbi:glycosyltransferase [Arenimonas alkanexedens]
MRILFSYYVGGGGGLSNIRQLLTALAESFPEDEVIIASRRADDFCDLSDLPNVHLHTIVPPVGGELGRLWYGTIGLRRLAVALGVDIVWSMNLGAYLRGAVPQVVSINNAYQVYPVPVVRMHPSGAVNALAIRLFSRLTIWASDLVIVQTEYMAAQVRRFCASAGKVLVVSKAVDVERLSESELAALHVPSRRNLEFTFGYVSTYFPHKNHQVLLSALDMLWSGDSKIKLIFTLALTDLPSKIRPRAEALISRGQLELLGWVSPSDLGSVYRRMDAVVIPSQLESLSSAHLEAMAFRKPILTSDLPFARELCPDAAIFVDPASPVAWADAMLALSLSPKTQAELVEGGSCRLRTFPADWQCVARTIRRSLAQVGGISAVG